MKLFKTAVALISVMALAFAFSTPSRAAVESETVKTFKVSDGVLDTTVSGDGKLFFVLSEAGVVEIYPTSGGSKEQIRVNGKADKIVSSESGDTLFLTDSKSGTTNLVSVSFIQKIDITGSPFKGPENAPIEVALFSDFQ